MSWQSRKENEMSELRVRFQEVPQFAEPNDSTFPNINSSLVHHNNLMTIIDERIHYYKWAYICTDLWISQLYLATDRQYYHMNIKLRYLGL